MAKRIGMIHYKTGGTDGVSLEMDKWQRVFTEAGHEVYYCSGRHDREFDQDRVPVTVIPELFYHRPEVERLNRAAFKDLSVFRDAEGCTGHGGHRNAVFADAHAADSGYADAYAMKSANADAHAADSGYADASAAASAESGLEASPKSDPEAVEEAVFRRELDRQTEALVPRLRKWIADNGLEVIVAENIWSAAVHPAAAKALRIAVQDTQIRVLGHHHDFFWERIGGAEPTCRTAELLADFCLPPNAEAYRHVVINSLAGETLRRRRGIQAGVIPNVFDFSGPEWVRDDFNRDLRQKIGLQEHDLMLLQATRIVERKGIELAVDFTAELQKRRKELYGISVGDGGSFGPASRIVLVLAGYSEDDGTGTYLQRLMDYAELLGVEILPIGDYAVSEKRGIDAETGGGKRYALWDVYAHGDIITYPSYWEGWGNQLLEAVKARLPIVMLEYPVYRSDIAEKGFDIISLGSEYRKEEGYGFISVPEANLQQAVDHAIEVLSRKEVYERMTAQNIRVARQYFSIEALHGYLEPYLKDWS